MLLKFRWIAFFTTLSRHFKALDRAFDISLLQRLPSPRALTTFKVQNEDGAKIVTESAQVSCAMYAWFILPATSPSTIREASIALLANDLSFLKINLISWCEADAHQNLLKPGV